MKYRILPISLGSSYEAEEVQDLAKKKRKKYRVLPRKPRSKFDLAKKPKKSKILPKLLRLTQETEKIKHLAKKHLTQEKN